MQRLRPRVEDVPRQQVLWKRLSRLRKKAAPHLFCKHLTKPFRFSEGFLLYPDIGICFLYNEIAVCQNLLLTYAENVIDYK